MGDVLLCVLGLLSRQFKHQMKCIPYSPAGQMKRIKATLWDINGEILHGINLTGQICSGGVPQAAVTVIWSCCLGREWHINSILRSVVSGLVFHHVILTLRV